MDYEKKLEELEGIVAKFEEGRLTIEEGVALFEEGVALTKACLEALSEYKGKITAIQDEVNKLMEQ